MTDLEIQNDSAGFNPNVRPAKRRKFYRKRTDDEMHELAGAPASTSRQNTPPPALLTLDELVSGNGHVSDGEDQHEETHLSVPEILRRRKAAQRRRGGIEFSNTSITHKSPSDTPQPNDAVNEKDETSADMKMVVNRFAPQTGQVADVNKHM